MGARSLEPLRSLGTWALALLNYVSVAFYCYLFFISMKRYRYLLAGAKLNVGWIRSVFYDVIHLFTTVLVDYDAKNASNPPYKRKN